MFRSIYSQLNNLLSFYKLFSFRQVISGVKHFPATVNFLITNNCNLSCSICSAHSMLDKSEQLDSSEINLFIKNIAKYKPVIFFGGGEPFIRGDIFDILACVKKCRLKYGIVTNGTLLDSGKIEKLFENEPEIMIFSVHGNEKGHDATTRIKGSFASALGAIELSLKKRKKTTILLNSVISPENYANLEDVIIQGKNLGVDRVRFENLIYLSKDEYDKHLKQCEGRLSLSESQLTTYIKDINAPLIGKDIQKEVVRLKKKYGKFIIFKPYMTDQERPGWFAQGFKFNRKCMFVRHSVFIKANGDIIPCQFFSEYKLGNIKRDDLSRVWQGRKRKDFTEILNKKILPGCMRCCKL